MCEQRVSHSEEASLSSSIEETEPLHWFVLRDLKRSNAKEPAYLLLQEAGYEVFTPLRWVLSRVQGKKVRKLQPFMQDLLFVHSTKDALDVVVDRVPTLQYRFVRGAGYCVPMTVREEEMTNFIRASRQSECPEYFQVDEISPQMIGRKVRIIGGPLNQCEGFLMSLRGSRVKHMIVQIEGLLAVKVEVCPEFIQFIT